MFFVSHKICNYCNELGHKKDMLVVISIHPEIRIKKYYHTDCYEIKYNVEPCPCGEGFINKEVCHSIHKTRR